MKYGIIGYGNLGRALEAAIRAEKGECTAIFTRRPTDSIHTVDAPAVSVANLGKYAGSIDVMLLAVASTDLAEVAPQILVHFNTVDAFDMHEGFVPYKKTLDRTAKKAQKTAIVGCGWDPGLFSVFRTYAAAVMPGSKINTFWGPGVSAGHTAALKSIPDVKFARSYTVPRPETKAAAREGLGVYSPTERHRRVSYIVLKEDTASARAAVRKAVEEMQDYFAGYENEVDFIGEEEFFRSHGSLGHCGEVISVSHSGTLSENREEMRLSVDLGANCEFTAGVMVAAARAAHFLAEAGIFGARTLLEIPPRFLLPEGTRPAQFF